jgi:high affinity sulfate transporter 1
LPDYRRDWLSADLVAGMTTAAVVIPKAMAYATIAGLPIQVGLYTAFVPAIIYAVLGTSRPLSATTTTTLAILTGAELAAVVPDGDPATLLAACALLTAMVGAILMAAAVLRLGFVANFISEPVLVGFKAGIGVVIVIDQVPKILGIHFAKGTFLHNIQEIGQGISHTSPSTLAVGLATVICLVGVEKLRPRWPAPLIAVAAAIAVAALLGLQDRGVELVGAIPAGLPALRLPDLELAKQLWPGACGIALMSFTETIAVGRAFANKDEPSPRANVELFATGLANAGGALLGSMPGGGGMSQTAVNRRSGARSQVAGLVCATMTLLTMLFLAPFIAFMPQATLAGVVIVYSVGLVQVTEFRNILRIRRTEFVWAASALLAVMLLGTLQGILFAIIVSLVALGQQVSDPPVYVLGRKPGTNVFRPRSAEHPEDESYPGLLLLRFEGRLFFLNAERVADKVRRLLAETKPTVVALDLSNVFDLEYSALKMLTEGEERHRAAGVELWLVGLNPQVFAMVRRSPLGAALGEERMFFNLEMAVAKYLAS